MDTVIVLAAPFIFAFVIRWLRGRLRAHEQGWLLAAVMAIGFVLLLVRLPVVTEQGALQVSIPWAEQIGLTFSLYLDGLSLLFGLVITGIGAAVVFYAGYYFEDADEAGRFLSLIMAFAGAMLGVVLAGNVITLFIAWELTSILSFLLIGFNSSDPDARKGASQALVITGGGGLALLVGLLLMSRAAGTADIAQILASGDALHLHPWYTAITILIILGCFAKSAQWPLHFWLPGAMSAPTPASAYLHSATMVKAGIFLLARLYPVLGDTPLWGSVLPTFGLITMLLTAALALRKRDLKAALAFSTLSQLGALVALIGLPHGVGIAAAMVGIIGHALYKCTLFLVAGGVQHATGTRNMDRLGGLRHHMPGFAIAASLAGLSMAGVPPLMGFIAKEKLLETAEHESTLMLAVVIISAVLTVPMALILVWDVFMRDAPQAADDDEHATDDHHDLHKLPPAMSGGPLALGALSLILGLGVGPLLTPLIGPAAGEAVKLYIFAPEFINLTLIISVIVLIAGTLIFLARRFWLGWKLPALPGAPEVYHALIAGVEWLGTLALKLQDGKIRNYLIIILITVTLFMTQARLTRLVTWSNIDIQAQNASDILKGVLLALALVATIGSILFRRHLLAVLALGISGYAIGGIFLLEPAPDVALVQFLVETLSTVLVIMILTRTSEPERRNVIDRVWHQRRIRLVRDIVVSTMLGVGVMLFALAAVQSRPTPQPIALWHLANALPLVETPDVVASIVTDFRGMDTMIEIAVFGMAALGVLTILTRPVPAARTQFILRPALMRGWRRLRYVIPDESVASMEPEQKHGGEKLGEDAIPKRATVEVVAPDEGELTYTSRFSDPLTRTVAVLVLPFAFLIALAHLLYGGSAPGDGFTAGVITGLGVALWYIVFGYQEARARLNWLIPMRLIGIGLTLALVNATLPFIFGRDFLAETALHIKLPADLHLTSTLVFETSIFITVFGGISAIMEAITHPREAEPL